MIYKRVFGIDPVPTTLPCHYCGKSYIIPAAAYAFIRLFGLRAICSSECFVQHTGIPVMRPVAVTWEE